MFDAQRLLSQVLSSAQAGDLQKRAQEMLGGGQAAAQSGARGGSGNGDLLKGALAGGVVGLLLGNKKARKFVGKTAGTALKVGGLAAVAGLAYTAWKNREAGTPTAALTQQSGGATHYMPAPMAMLEPPRDSGFAPQNAPGGADSLARAALVAMIQGAKADGHIDGEEHQRIFGHIESLALDADAKAFVMDELAAPLDPARVASLATTPETAAEIYAASLLAMVPDTPAERAYLDDLARRLRLDPGLAAEIERSVAAAL